MVMNPVANVVVRHFISLSKNIGSRTSFKCQFQKQEPKWFHSTSRILSSETIPITFITAEGETRKVDAEIGIDLMNLAQENDIELEGACGGELACATCHLIFEQEIYAKLPEKIEEEDDMLDLALGLTETSRLGCQICATKDLAGMKVYIPAEE